MNEQIKEIHKDMIIGELEIKDVIINIERDSVSLGDDITAPHHTQKFFSKDNLISSLFEKILYDRYIPEIAGSIWDISYNNKVLGQIYFNKDSKGIYELFVSDEAITFLNNSNIYCKHVKN